MDAEAVSEGGDRGVSLARLSSVRFGGPVRVNFRRGKATVVLLDGEDLQLPAEALGRLSARGYELFGKAHGEEPVEADDPGVAPDE